MRRDDGCLCSAVHCVYCARQTERDFQEQKSGVSWDLSGSAPFDQSKELWPRLEGGRVNSFGEEATSGRISKTSDSNAMTEPLEEQPSLFDGPSN